MLLENSNTIVFEDVGRKLNLGLTTPNSGQDYVATILSEVYTTPEKFYFATVNLPDSYIFLPINGKKRPWMSINQYQQYKFMRSRINLLDIDTKAMYVWFEQTRKGIIHMHMIIISQIHIQDLKADLCSLFNLSKLKDIMFSIHAEEIHNFQGMYEYCFNKNVKMYEQIDQHKFSPLKKV